MPGGKAARKLRLADFIDAQADPGTPCSGAST